MRVAQVIDSLRMSGGAERLQLLFAKAVAGSDVALTVITLRVSDPGMVSALEALGVRVVAFPAGSFLSPARALRLTRFLRRESFDVIHTHLVRATVLGILAGRAAAIPTVATLHNTRRNHRLPDALRVAEDLVLRHAADRVTAVGWETARVHRARLRGRRIDVIPNAVDAGCTLSDVERARIRRELGVGPDELLVIAVGRLHPQKAFSDLLHAIAILRAQGHPVQLRIAGVGPLEQSLRAEIESRQLGDCVLLGLRDDVPRLLAASDVYASSAAWEGLPIATLEAMAAGLPVVATAVGDVTRIVDSETGILVPPGQPDELAGALAEVLSDARRRRAQGDAARRRARLHHAVEPWSGRLLELYEEMLGRRPIERPTESTEGPACA
jgi:glycosyltransferase involved in cell wall biosynthesis